MDPENKKLLEKSQRDVQQGEEQMRKETIEKWVMTCAIYYCNLTLGVAGSYLAPVLMSFAAEYHTDMRTLSIIITISRYINIASSLAFGFIYGVLNRHAVVTALIFQMALVVTIMPYSGSLTVFGLLFALLNVSFGGYNTAQTIWVIEIWKEKSGPFVQAQHFLFAIGCIVPPLVFAPFLEKHQSATTASMNASRNETKDHMAAVYIPSLICGTVVGIGAVLMLVTFFMYGRYKHTTAVLTTDHEDNPGELNDGLKKGTPMSIRKCLVILFSSLILGGTASMETVANTYLPTYVHYAFGFTEAAAAKLFGVFQLSFTLARLAGIFIIMKVSPKPILIGNLSIVAGASFLLIFTTTTTSAYIGSSVLGIGFSTIFPTVYAYLQAHLEFTHIIASVLLVGGLSIASFTPMIVGSYIETFANIVTWLNVGTDVIMAVSLVIVAVAVSGVEGKL